MGVRAELGRDMLGQQSWGNGRTLKLSPEQGWARPVLWVMVQRGTGVESRDRANQEAGLDLQHQVQSQDLKGWVGVLNWQEDEAGGMSSELSQRKICTGKNFYGWNG